MRKPELIFAQFLKKSSHIYIYWGYIWLDTNIIICKKLSHKDPIGYFCITSALWLNNHNQWHFIRQPIYHHIFIFVLVLKILWSKITLIIYVGNTALLFYIWNNYGKPKQILPPLCHAIPISERECHFYTGT